MAVFLACAPWFLPLGTRDEFAVTVRTDSTPQQIDNKTDLTFYGGCDRVQTELWMDARLS
jgi:hypothetical protein